MTNRSALYVAGFFRAFEQFHFERAADVQCLFYARFCGMRARVNRSKSQLNRFSSFFTRRLVLGSSKSIFSFFAKKVRRIWSVFCKILQFPRRFSDSPVLTTRKDTAIIKLRNRLSWFEFYLFFFSTFLSFFSDVSASISHSIHPILMCDRRYASSW